ncbi:hypothetical protein ILYODFUR_014473 [Ilyodon furcidens]|uniref:Uncharacterized protein n=1 Tax=Ilyodon furcidens TaxID=33524 RepID=A0ABV0TIL8_9TELE
MFMVLHGMLDKTLKADKRLRCNPCEKGPLRSTVRPGNSQQELNFLGTCSAFTCVFIIDKNQSPFGNRLSQPGVAQLCQSAQVLINHLGIHVEQNPHPLCDTNNSDVVQCVCMCVFVC